MHMLLCRLVDYDPHKFIYKQLIRIVTSKGPTPLKTNVKEKRFQLLLQRIIDVVLSART